MVESAEKIPLALDLVEEGTTASLQATGAARVDRKLPEGVTSKHLYRDVFRIAWPSLVELTLTQLTSMVDLMMVGGLGPVALAAVGLTTQPKFLLMTMFIAMNVGATALVARYKGAGRRDRANHILRQALVLTFVTSAIASILGYVFAEDMVRFMSSGDPAAVPDATVYLRIQMIGFVPFALTSTITATLRGVGNSRTAMIYNLIANVVNVIGNYLLIHGHFGFPRMEVAGASLATIIGQGAAFLMAGYVVLKGNSYLRIRLRDGFAPVKEDIKSILNIGLPAMAEQLLMRTGVMVFIRTVASLGTVAFATHNVAMNIQALSFMSGQAFAVSATSLVGQSLGKKRPDMAQAYANHTRRLGLIVALIIAAVFFFFGRQVVGLYTDELQIMVQGAMVLKLVALTQPFQSSQFILAGALRGAGDTRATALITFITVMLVRPGLAMVNVNYLGWGLLGAWVALVADQLLRSLLVVLRYKSGKWKTIRV
ncbi:MAG TPA: MATE family efflux transporter [Firmicutes bacterium]|jgi:putative MATE family efflux protein|nr:MATE family efflux transporter [Bacillota bacterium]